MNHLESDGVRIAAFLMTMRTYPSLTVLETIVHKIRREDSPQIVSFVSSYLRTVAVAHNPILRHM